MKNVSSSSKGGLRRSGAALGALAVLSLLSACDKKAEGQVVAVVQGDEITSQEVNGELQNAPKLEGDEGQKLRNMALERVVDRRLLSDIAKKEGIDSSPEYILRKKKLDESLLIQMLGEKLSRDEKQPSAADIQKTITDNPQVFADRTLFAVDQIVFPTPERKDVVKAIEPTKTMDEVVAVLNRFGIKFQRGNNQIDSANLSPEMFANLQRVGSAEPFIVPNGPTVAVGKIMATKKVPVIGEDARQAATNLYKKQTVGDAMKKKLEEAKKAADIKYQSGFGPPETSPTGVPGMPAASGSASPMALPSSSQ